MPDPRPSNISLIPEKRSTRSIKKLSATSTARPRIMVCPRPETRLSAQRRGRRAYRWELESEKESDGGLCQVSDFVEVEGVELKVGNLVHEAAILGAHTKVGCDVEI